MRPGFEVKALKLGQRVRATDLHLTGSVVEINAPFNMALIDFANHERWCALSSLEPLTDHAERFTSQDESRWRLVLARIMYESDYGKLTDFQRANCDEVARYSRMLGNREARMHAHA